LSSDQICALPGIRLQRWTAPCRSNGLRYGGSAVAINPDTHTPWGASSLMVILIVLLTTLLIGLITAFLGLAFHHYRRYHEHLRENETPRRKSRRELSRCLRQGDYVKLDTRDDAEADNEHLEGKTME